MITRRSVGAHNTIEVTISAVGQAILPAAGFQPAGPAGKRVRSLKRLPHNTVSR